MKTDFFEEGKSRSHFTKFSEIIKLKDKFIINEFFIRLILVFVSAQFINLLVYNYTRSFMYVSLVALFQVLLSFLFASFNYNYEIKKSTIFLTMILLSVCLFAFGYFYVLQKDSLLIFAVLIPAVFSFVMSSLNRFKSNFLPHEQFSFVLRSINQIGLVLTSFLMIFFGFLIDILPTKQSLTATFDLVRILAVNDFYLIYVLGGAAALIYALFFFFNSKDAYKKTGKLVNLSSFRKDPLILIFSLFNSIVNVSLIFVGPFLYESLNYLKYRFTAVTLIFSLAMMSSVVSPRIVYSNLRRYGAFFVALIGLLLFLCFPIAMLFFEDNILYIVLGIYLGTLGASMATYSFEYTLTKKYSKEDFAKSKFSLQTMTAFIETLILLFSSFSLIALPLGLIYKLLFAFTIFTSAFYVVYSKFIFRNRMKNIV